MKSLDVNSSILLKICDKLYISPQIIILFCIDLFILLSASTLSFTIRSFFSPQVFAGYETIIPFLLLGPIFCMAFGSYQTIALPPQNELKYLFISISLTFLAILAILFVTKTADTYSRAIIIGAWAISTVAIPIARGYTRRYFAQKIWWGRPVVICSSEKIAEDIKNSLAQNPERGLYTVEIITISEDTVQDATLYQRLSGCAAKYHKPMCILCNHHAHNTFDIDLINEISQYFNGLLLIPFADPLNASMWLASRDLGSVTGLYVRQNLLDKRRLGIKRFFDLSISLAASVFTLPITALIALSIRLESSGNVFYSQQRTGQNGKVFKVYKFRTMVTNADEVLHTYLKDNPSLEKEWLENHKLKNDPRLTKVGKFLRKTSLDELPQLYNVFAGSMSLVGPRPIVPAEIQKYGHVYKEYCLVKPGITGLWQISGRNDTSYDDRVRLDHYYVCNWSVWLDLWILLRTIPVVLKGSGAY